MSTTPLMFKTQRNFIEIVDVLYEILKIIPIDHNPIVSVWKEELRADKCFKRDGVYLFVREVPEAEIVPDEITLIENNDKDQQ